MNVLSLNILLLVTANRQKENLFLNVSLLAATANHLLTLMKLGWKIYVEYMKMCSSKL